MRTGFGLLAGLATVVVAFHFLAGTAIAQTGGDVPPSINPFTVWNVDPVTTLALFLAAYLYVTGLNRWERPSHPVNLWQRLSFFAGLLAIFIAIQSPIDYLAEQSLAFHQVQHMLLRMIAPLLVLLGAPLTPTLRGLPSWALKGVVRPVVRNRGARRAYEILTNPVVTTIVFLGVLYLWQVPGPHNLALRNDAVHELMHVTMLFSGLLFWWLVIDPKPHHSRLHYGLRVLYLGLIVIPNTLLGAAITFSGDLIYSGYPVVEMPFNISPMTDQQLGGLILWVPGDMMSIIAAAIVMVMWYQREAAEEEVDTVP